MFLPLTLQQRLLCFPLVTEPSLSLAVIGDLCRVGLGTWILKCGQGLAQVGINEKYEMVKT